MLYHCHYKSPGCELFTLLLNPLVHYIDLYLFFFFKFQIIPLELKVHFVATFLNNFLIVFVSVLRNLDCISFDNLPKKYRNRF